MKKYLKFLPLIIYPYAYLLYFILLFKISEINKELGDILSAGFLILLIGYNVITLITIIVNIISTVKKGNATEAAKVNIAVKYLHIPAYIFHFLMGTAGMLMSVWGIGFIMIAVIVDILTIFLSGLNALSCSIKLRKDGKLKKGTSILLSIGSFIYCVDLAVAIIYLLRSKVTEIKKV